MRTAYGRVRRTKATAEIIEHALRSIDRHGESDSDAAAVWSIDRGIDSDDIALRIEQWTTAVPGIDRRVCLDQPFEGLIFTLEASGPAR